MALPFPPQTGFAGMGAQPQMQGPAPGTLPYQQSAWPAALQGIANAIKEYRATSQLDKQQALQEFEQYRQLAASGMPIDPKKMKKAADRAGIPIDWEGFSKEQIEQQVNFDQQMVAAAPGGGSTQPVTPASGQFGGAVDAVSNPAAMTDAWKQFSAAQGLAQPPTSMPSPGMMWLQALQQQGQGNMDLAQLMQNVNFKKGSIELGALQGNPKAQEMMTKMGGWKAPDMLERMDQWLTQLGYDEDSKAGTLLDLAMGGPANRQKAMELAVEQAKNDVQTMIKVAELTQNYIKEGIAPQIGMQLALGTVTKNPELITGAMQVLAQTKTPAQKREDREEKKDLREERMTKVSEQGMQLRQEEFKFDKVKFADISKRGWAELDLKEKALMLDHMKATTEVMNKLYEQHKDNVDLWFKVATSKDAGISDQGKEEAWKNMVDAINKMGPVSFMSIDKDGKPVQKTLDPATLKPEMVREWFGMTPPWGKSLPGTKTKFGIGQIKKPGDSSMGQQAPGKSGASWEETMRILQEFMRTAFPNQGGMGVPMGAGVPPGGYLPDLNRR